MSSIAKVPLDSLSATAIQANVGLTMTMPSYHVADAIGEYFDARHFLLHSAHTVLQTFKDERQKEA
eukprot:7074575-Karenia_brevis.AAC.1